MPVENKCNDVDYQERVSQVMDMLLAGLRRKEILQTIANYDQQLAKDGKLKDQWNVTPSQIDNYIREAKEEIYKPIEKDREKLKAKAYARYEYLYKKLLNVKDYKSAIIANDKICILTGINEASKFEFKGENIIPSINIYTNAPPVSNSEDDIDVKR